MTVLIEILGLLGMAGLAVVAVSILAVVGLVAAAVLIPIEALERARVRRALRRSSVFCGRCREPIVGVRCEPCAEDQRIIAETRAPLGAPPRGWWPWRTPAPAHRARAGGGAGVVAGGRLRAVVIPPATAHRREGMER